MCCFLASQRLYYLLVGGAPVGKCLHQYNSSFCIDFLSFCTLFFSLPFSPWFFLAPLSSSVPLSIASSPWADVCCQAALLFLFFRVLIRNLLFPLFLSSSLSFAWSLSLRPTPTISSVYILFPYCFFSHFPPPFFSSLHSVWHNRIHSVSLHPVFDCIFPISGFFKVNFIFLSHIHFFLLSIKLLL